MRCLLPVAALITLAQPGANALSAQRSAPPRQVVSTWQIERDGRGQELSRTFVNRRLEFGFCYIEGKPIDLLFVEEVRTTFKRSEEGDNGRVVVEAWASDRPDTAYRRRIWRLDMPGSRVALRPDYYDVVQTGCCGSNDTHTVSLATGQPVISFTDGPLYFQGGDTGLPSSQGSFVITYLNTNAVLESPALHAEPTAVGELDFVEGDVVRTRLLFTSSDKNLIGLPTPTVSLVASDGRVGREGISIAKDQTAFVRLVWEDGPTVDIPISGKSFDISGAKLPAVVKARIVR